ncbi:uncharacterized protein LOC142772222 [Rhipicephalus microplus]|uniref:uncharacterized protein LOC142772222 n=1 Tax=Rhipicephalus microplus TaxID=6941 RepID=UPI003F6B090B
MKRAILSSFNVAKITESGRKRPRSETTREIATPPPAIFAPFPNTWDDFRRSRGAASREHLIPSAVEPRRSTTLNKVNFQRGYRTLERQSRASQTSGTMFTSDTRTGANASSNMASNVSAVSGETQGSNFSETGRKSHSEQMTDKSKDTDFEGRLGQIQGASSRLLPVGVCILALVIMAVLVLFVFSTSCYTASVKVLEEKRTEDEERKARRDNTSAALYLYGFRSSLSIVEETSYRHHPLQVAALRLSARAAAGAHVTLANSYNHHEGDPVPEAEQGAVRDPEDILDPSPVLAHGCLPSAMVCSKEISTGPGHPRSRAPNHR